jgi:2-polyprenyl-3-methyl-5-hydroxy-6-metoxy-1,4-benzoquinol methylase
MMTDRVLVCCPGECDSQLAETSLALPEGNLLGCTVCGQLISQIRKSEYRASMQEFDTATGTLPGPASQGRHDQRAARMFNRLKTMLNVEAGDRLRLIDVGCSTGALIVSARQHGIDAEGVEPAHRAAVAAQAAGFKVFPGALAEASYPSSSFHAVTLIEVIEHLAHPGEVLREIWRILEPDGILVVATGNAASWTVRLMGGRWDYFQVSRHGGHISFFTPQSLRCLAARCGFRIERIETRHVRFVESYQASKAVYRALKIAGEALNVPAKLLNKGHDMLMFLKKV